MYRFFCPHCYSVVYGAMGCEQKNCKLAWLDHQLLFAFLANDHLPECHVILVGQLMIRVIMNIPGTVHKSSDIYLISEENPQTSARRPTILKAVRSFIASDGIPYLQMRSVGSQSTSEREKEEMEERIGSGNHTIVFISIQRMFQQLFHNFVLCFLFIHA